MSKVYVAPSLESYGSLTALTSSNVKCSPGPDALNSAATNSRHAIGDENLNWSTDPNCDFFVHPSPGDPGGKL